MFTYRWKNHQCLAFDCTYLAKFLSIGSLTLLKPINTNNFKTNLKKKTNQIRSKSEFQITRDEKVFLETATFDPLFLKKMTKNPKNKTSFKDRLLFSKLQSDVSHQFVVFVSMRKKYANICILNALKIILFL